MTAQLDPVESDPAQRDPTQPDPVQTDPTHQDPVQSDPALHPLRLRVLGTSVAVRFEGGLTPAHAETLRRAWSRCVEADDGAAAPERVAEPELGPPGGSFRATLASGRGTRIVEAGTFGHFAADLTSAVTLAAIEARAGEAMMLHASALADPASGRAVALVGRSGMGKTTATRALAGRLGYVTDEAVAVEASGVIAPYPKPLSIITGDAAAPKSQMGPDELGLRPAPAQARLAAVVLLDRNPEAPRPGVTPLGHAEAIIALAPQTSALARARQPLAWLCALLDACGGAVRITYREAHELPELVEGLLERGPIPARWAPAGSESGKATDDGAARPGALLHRARVVDAVEIFADDDHGTELVALVGASVVRLSGVAPAIWRALETPACVEQLAGRLADDIPLPADYEARLREAVTELERHSLLSWAATSH